MFSCKQGIISFLILSFFLMVFLGGCGLFSAKYTLTMEVEGQGKVAPGEGKHSYEEDTIVDIEADPEEGWKFREWVGEVAGSESATTIVLMDEDKEITAVFERQDYSLGIEIIGEGEVEQEVLSKPLGDHKYETVVQLTAVPDAGWKFKEWQGDVVGTDVTIEVEMDEDKELTAVFERQDYSLEIEIIGEGEVEQEVLSKPSGDYEYETVVQLTAIPDAGWKFKEWQGDVVGIETKIEVKMDGAKDITAVFSEITHKVTFRVEFGDGEITATADGNEISSGSWVVEGSKLIFKAKSEKGNRVKDWIVDGDSISFTDGKHIIEELQGDIDVGVKFMEIPQKEYTLEGNVTFEMRLAPASTFPIGTEDRFSASVNDDFWVSETQVTYELWYKVFSWATHDDRGEDKYNFKNSGEGSGQRPVTNVDWYDSIVWCNAISEYLGYDPVYAIDGEVIRGASGISNTDVVAEDRDGFRLPTSLEWELAARYQGSNSSYGAIEYPAGSGNFWTPGNYASGATGPAWEDGGPGDIEATKEAAWYLENSEGKTQDVGQKPEKGNGLGVFDMSGNVSEWCFTPRWDELINRGGSFVFAERVMQIGWIRSSNPSWSFDFVGLRLVRTNF